MKHSANFKFLEKLAASAAGSAALTIFAALSRNFGKFTLLAKLAVFAVLSCFALILLGCDDAPKPASKSTAAQTTPAQQSAEQATTAAHTTPAQTPAHTPAVAQQNDNASQLPEVAIILDWLPNTNHSGLIIAQKMGLFEGIRVRIIPSGEESATDLVIAGKVPFGVYFQDYLAPKIARGAPIAAVAAIAARNTSGLIANADLAALSGARYGTYNYPIELAMLEEIFAARGLKAPKLVPNDGYSAASAIAAGAFDFANAFYAYDGLAAEAAGYSQKFFYYADLDARMNFYTPLIVANSRFLAEHPARAKAFICGLKRGYEYAAAHPAEAAEALAEYARASEAEREFIRRSQEFLSAAYLDEQGKWGRISPERWDGFWHFINSSERAQKAMPRALGDGEGHFREANRWLNECED